MSNLTSDNRPRLEIPMDTISIAFARGNKDSENHLRLVRSGERGMYIKDAYPSNPYNKEGDYANWQAYNRGWNSNAF